jgi:cytidylate kinase
MATITISRQFGAGGTTLGVRLSKRLGYRYYNDELIKEVAKKRSVSPSQVSSFEKKGPSKLMKLLDWVLSPDFIERHTSGDRLHEMQYVVGLSEIIQNIWKKDNAVIIGRGGNYVLKDFENTLHVLLVADRKHRMNFLIDNYKLKKSEAEKAIDRADMIRSRFLNCFSEEHSHDDPRIYTIVLNMNDITMDKAEDIIVGLITDK